MPQQSPAPTPKPELSLQILFDRFTMKVFWVVLAMTILAIASMGPAEALHRINDNLAGAAGYVENLPGEY